MGTRMAPIVDDRLHDEGRGESLDSRQHGQAFVVDNLKGVEVGGEHPKEKSGSPKSRWEATNSA